jgi:regulator of protease activity HflC (stomatin/prohibitin superfamily)
MMFDYLSYLLLVVVVVMFFSAAIRILREYERGIVFTLGRFTGVKRPDDGPDLDQAW